MSKRDKETYQWRKVLARYAAPAVCNSTVGAAIGGRSAKAVPVFHIKANSSSGGSHNRQELQERHTHCTCWLLLSVSVVQLAVIFC